MKNICHFITSLNIGGAEKLLLEIANRLDKTQYQLSIISLLGGELENELRSTGAQVTVIGLRSKLDISALFKLYSYFRNNKVDILHTHLYHPAIIGRLIGSLARIPVIISTYHYSYLYKRHFNMFLDRLTVRLNKWIIAVSQASVKFCTVDEKLPPEKIKLIYNGISLDDIKQVDCAGDDRLFDSRHRIVGSVGRLCWDKGYQYFLRAAKIVLTEFPDVRFVLIGDGPTKEALEEESRKLNIQDKVLFTGRRNDVARLLWQFNIFVLSSVNEGLPVALLEAMARQRPVVVTDVGGCIEVVTDQENGLVADKENPEMLAEKIKLLLRDEVLAGQLARNAEDLVRNKFSADKMVKELEDIYSEAI